MLKKFVSIFMLYSALAIMLGHNVIPHTHHDNEHNKISHHHNDGQHNNDTEDEREGWSHIFLNLQHGAEGLTFLTSVGFADNFSKQITTFTTPCISNFIFNQEVIEVRQNAPPYIDDYYNSHSFLPSGLRAPPSTNV